MTKEEFDQLPPEEQDRLMQQMQQAQAMRMTFSRDDPYNAVGQDPYGPSKHKEDRGSPPMGAAMQMMNSGGGSGGGAGMGAAAWPAALAAVVVGNETWANKEGRRPDDFGDHAQDMFTGKVLEYDTQALSDKMPGKSGELVEIAGEMGNPEGLVSNIGKMLKPWDWF
jgi:hypothetical protein